MYTKEEKEKIYNIAVETLTNAFAEFYNWQKLKFANELILNWVTQEEILDKISKYLYQWLPLQFHRKTEEIRIRDIQEYWILDNFTWELSKLTDWDFKALCFILFELEQNKDEIYSKNLKIFSDYQTKEAEDDFDLKAFWQKIQKLTNSALEWSSDLLKIYTLLKRIESWTKIQADKLKDFAYNQYVDRGFTARDEIAYWYWFAITTRTTIKYDEDLEYSEINQKLKSRESILKNAVEQNKKGNTVVDENGEIMNVPTYWFSSSLTIKKI